MSFSVCANIFAVLALSASTLAAQTAPRVFLLNPTTLAQQKTNSTIVKATRKEADKALKMPPQSVTTKTKTPPSGDKHDYMSMARYFWPNPATPNHLPYIRKDGQSNPEINDIPDHEGLDHTADASRAVALGWYLTGDEHYA
ncbi:MAG TPA: alginate lyase family protein, partial [Acidobacteriaceae bacterium]|nr:alginate lyase family protein [Acidobacteriaceae bacterium]